MTGVLIRFLMQASKVLFALSVNNFKAVFSRVSGRLQELSVSSEENPDHTDIELIQHIDVDLSRYSFIISFV
jgi:neurofibromin 1